MYLTMFVDDIQLKTVHLKHSTRQYGEMKGRMLLEDYIGYEITDEEAVWEEFKLGGEKGLSLTYEDVVVYWFHREITEDDEEEIWGW